MGSPLGLSSTTGLRDIARALSSALDLDRTLDLIVRKTTGLLSVDSCTLYVLEPDSKTLRLMATTGLRPQVLGSDSLKVGEGMTGAAVSTDQPIHAIVAREHPAFKLLDEERERELTSLLAIPLTVREAGGRRPMGAMNVQTVEPHTFTRDEIELLLLVGDLAAGALTKAQIYREQKSEIAEMRALAKVSEAATSPQYLDDMLDIVTDMAARSMNVAVCALYLVDRSGKKLVMSAVKRLSAMYRPREPLTWGKGIIGRVAETCETAYVAEVLRESEFANHAFAKEEGLVSMLAVPLAVRGRCIGVVSCYTTEVRQFTEDEVAFFSTLANQTALAIENAQLVTNAAVTREMHHRIKNSLQMIVMLMQIQLPEAERMDTREVLLGTMSRIRSIGTVHEALSEKGFRLVDVRDVLGRLAMATVSAFTAPQRQIEITVSGDPLPLPSKPATSIAMVVNELVQNGVEHAFRGRKHGKITISLVRTSEQIKIWVRDDGIGISGELQGNFGLELADMLIKDEMGGDIQFERMTPGTEVVIVLPISIEDDYGV